MQDCVTINDVNAEQAKAAHASLDKILVLIKQNVASGESKLVVKHNRGGVTGTKIILELQDSK